MKALFTTFAIVLALTCSAQDPGIQVGDITYKEFIDTTPQKLFYDQSSGPIMGYMVRKSEMKYVWKLDKNKQGFWMPTSGGVKETYFLDKNKKTRLPKPLYVN